MTSTPTSNSTPSTVDEQQQQQLSSLSQPNNNNNNNNEPLRGVQLFCAELGATVDDEALTNINTLQQQLYDKYI